MNPVHALCLLPALLAAADAPAMIDVVAGPLPQCLEQITGASGARFIVTDALARSAPECRAVNHAPSAAGALDAALQGTDVRWHLRDDGVFLLASTERTAAAKLAPLVIVATAVASEPEPETRPPLPLVADLRSETRYDAPTLAAKPVLRFGQLSRLAPNVYSSGESLSIRGVPRDNDYFSGVSVFYDGIDVGTLLLDDNLLAVDDLESLRFVRGGSAFLHGNGSVGGAVYLDTPKPTPELGGRVTASAGQRSSRALGGSIAGPLLDAGLSGRVSVSRSEDPRFVRNRLVTSIDGDTDSRERVNAKLLFEPDAVPGLTIGATAFHIDGDAPDRTVARLASQPPSSVFDGISYDSSARDWDLRATGRGLNADYARAGGLSIAAYASELDVTRDALVQDDTIVRVSRGADESRKRLGAKAVLPLFDGWRAYVGIERQLIDSTQLLINEVVTPSAGTTGAIGRDSNLLRLNNIGIAFELAYDPGGRWRASAGARHVDENVDFLLKRKISGDGAPTTTQVLLRTHTDYRRTLPVAGLEFDLNERHQLGLSYGRGYRSGGNSEYSFIQTYAPERLSTIELAWRARWLHDRLHSSASLFHTDWRDRTSIDGTIGAEILEPIETRILGAEFELEAELGESWSLRGGLGWLDSEYTRGRYALSSVPYDLDGRKAADAPHATAILGAIWRGPRGWYASADAYHAARAESSTFVASTVFPQDSTLAPPPPRDAYTVLDLRVGWRREPWSVALTVGNALDENYIDRYVERRPASRRIGEPRQVDLSVSWDW